MTQVLVVQSANFGALASEAMAELLDAQAKLTRVVDAITAAGGYQAGSPAGSAFEIASTSQVSNNFGVVENTASPGTNGSAWAYAINNIGTALNTFISTQIGAIQTVDQGIILS